MHLTLALIILLLGVSPAQSRFIQTFLEVSPEETESNIEEDDFSVSALIEKANKNLEVSEDGVRIEFGDIAVKDGLQNADKCVLQQCKWPKSRDGLVYIPYTISSEYGWREISIIQGALCSFEKYTCIRFIPRGYQTDFLQFVSNAGCYSFVGRQGGPQILSLARAGCIYEGVIQHELLHALGFQHEQCRSDRDLHVRILFENIEAGKENNFGKLDTINLNTTYDYNSIMHYKRTAFSKNGMPTIIPIPNPDVPIGLATEMDANDIQRVKKLYCL